MQIATRNNDAQELAPTLIEVGWIIAGRLEDVDRKAVETAHQTVLDQLEMLLPCFRWQMPMILRDESVIGPRTEPTLLLEDALAERNINHWDFTLVVTGTDLVSYHKPYALAVVSEALDAAVLSTSRIDPRAASHTVSAQERVDAMAPRIAALALHALGHLNGLSHDPQSDNYMYEPHGVAELDEMQKFSKEQVLRLQEFLREVADLRLEERAGSRDVSFLSFYLRGVWINRREIASALWQARPWQFPFRLSRLTVASLSTMLIMLLTAEAWDLGASQPVAVMLLLPVVSIIATTAYVVARQRLLLRRDKHRLTEQTVTTNVSTLAIVTSGMVATFFTVFLLAALLILLLFDESLVERWATSVEQDIGVRHFVALAVFAASIGLGVGALGASFEGQHFFRHVTFVDEET